MNVLIVSESFIVRDSVNNLFNYTLNCNNINAISNTNELLNEELKSIDFLFIDINKENIEILKRLSKIKDKCKKPKIMVLDSKRDMDIFLKAIEYGIDGYTLNISDKEEFVYLINKILNGKKFYDPEVLQYKMSRVSVNNENILTNKEKSVLTYVSKGLTNKNIAEELNVTDYTIKKHVSSILHKLNLKNRQDIIIYAKGSGIIDEIV